MEVEAAYNSLHCASHLPSSYLLFSFCSLYIHNYFLTKHMDMSTFMRFTPAVPLKSNVQSISDRTIAIGRLLGVETMHPRQAVTYDSDTVLALGSI